MSFSQRTAWNTEENAFAEAVRLRRARGPVLDLTLSNPTVCGFDYGPNLFLPLVDATAFRYEPAPFGAIAARAAVAKYYAELGAEVSTDNICLTTSTSEAYSYLFRLLCDPGDEVLVARPSYPLFEYLAALDSVRLVEYPLHGDGEWFIDKQVLEAAITPQTRAIIVVHPNNPTGNYCSTSEREWLQQLCAVYGLALIVDEVFLDYELPDNSPTTFAASQTSALTFILSGISKVCALPQMKCSWIVVAGDDERAMQALARLEVIADTFLSMNSPIQHALPHWLNARHNVQSQILDRMALNIGLLDEMLAGTQLTRLALQGGWTAVLRVPRTLDELPYCEGALEHGVLLQPGEFYGLPEGRAVLSLLTPPDVLRKALLLLRKLSEAAT